MNRIIFYGFILTAVSISLHGAPNRRELKETIIDIKNLKRQMKDIETQLPVPSENDSDDLSCFVAELRKFLDTSPKENYSKTIRRLIKKTTYFSYINNNCAVHDNQTRSTIDFLDRMENILQNRFKG